MCSSRRRALLGAGGHHEVERDDHTLHWHGTWDDAGVSVFGDLGTVRYSATAARVGGDERTGALPLLDFADLPGWTPGMPTIVPGDNALWSAWAARGTATRDLARVQEQGSQPW